MQEPNLRLFLHQVATSFDLTDEQVDKLIEAGRELLRRNPEFQRLLDELGGPRSRQVDAVGVTQIALDVPAWMTRPIS